MSYICQSCGAEYGDPALGEIPIICSECVDTGEDLDDEGPESIDAASEDLDDQGPEDEDEDVEE